MNDTRQFCTFSVDGLYFGVAVETVREVIRYQDMTRVPLAPDVVKGLINLRGEIVTAVDLRRRLGLGDREDGAPPMNVVLTDAGETVSLLVDEIGDVVEVADELSEEPPATLRGLARELIRRVYKLDNRLLLVLDPQRTLDAVA